MMAPHTEQLNSKQILVMEMIKEAMGSWLVQQLENPDVTEIMVNPDGLIWIDDHEQGLWCSDQHMAVSSRMLIINTLASLADQQINEDDPSVAATLPYRGARFHGIIPPAVEAPTFTLRMPSVIQYTLQDYVSSGQLEPKQAALLYNSFSSRLNVLVVGGTGSGKTTFANALLKVLEGPVLEKQRIMVIEDTPELVVPHKNAFKVKVNRQTRFNYKRALVDALRMSPDRIIVGELRDGLAALELLKAWNTGHNGGLATLHANSAASALPRLEQLLQEELRQPPRALIAQAINVVVYVERYHDQGKPKRRIREVLKLHEELGANGAYQFDRIAHSSVGRA